MSATDTRNRVCVDHDVCTLNSAPHGPGQYTKVEGGAKHPRVCAALKTCDYSTEYEFKAPSQYVDRDCRKLRT